MKKLIVILLFSVLILFSFVSAQQWSGVRFPAGTATGIEDVFNGIAESLSPIAVALLGSDSDGILDGDQLFVKVLVFILVLVFINASVKKMPLLQDKSVSAFLVAAIISIIGVRFITTERLIEFIWLPANTFAAAFVAIITFGAFFFLIETFDSRVIRRFSWTTILFIFTYFAISRINDAAVSDTGIVVSWIYLGIALISGILILADRKIHAMLYTGAHNKIVDRSKRIQAINIQGEIDDLYKTLARTVTPADRTAVEAQIATKEATLKT